MIAGITGKYCSGKNTVCDLFVKRGWVEIDVDRLGHEALEIKSQEVIAVFGREITDSGGKIDRKKLAGRVFGSKKALRDLESILHPQMVEMCRNRIKELEGRNVIINAAVLHRMGLNKLCGAVIWVKSPFIERLRRSMKRDNHSLLHSLKRMLTQKELDAKYWSEDVDSYTIWNNSSIAELEAEVARLSLALGERS